MIVHLLSVLFFEERNFVFVFVFVSVLGVEERKQRCGKLDLRSERLPDLARLIAFDPHHLARVGIGRRVTCDAAVNA